MSAWQSCFYQGWVLHRRQTPRYHSFRYPLSLLYLDLDEIEALFSGSWWRSCRRWAPVSWRRQDYLGAASGLTLSESVRQLVTERTGQRPNGPIRLLTHPRYWGYGFNPVSFYYCYDLPGDRQPSTIVAEITNTPWGERHAYVLPIAQAETRGDWHLWRMAKAFHVSPFMPMTQDYEWRFSQPGEYLGVFMANEENGARCFDATLRLTRQPWSAATLAMSLIRWPFQTVGVVLGIYWQALRLWLKGVPFHSHPKSPAQARPAVTPEPSAPLVSASHQPGES